MTEEAEELVRVAVNTETCVGAGQCEMLQPDVFLVDDDEGISSVIGDGLLSPVQAATVIYRCPGQAISIAED